MIVSRTHEKLINLQHYGGRSYETEKFACTLTQECDDKDYESVSRALAEACKKEVFTMAIERVKEIQSKSITSK